MYNVKITKDEETYDLNYEGIFLIGMNPNKDGDAEVDFHGNIPEEMAFAAMCESMQRLAMPVGEKQ